MKKMRVLISIMLVAVVVVSMFLSLSACQNKPDPDEGKSLVQKDTFYKIDLVASSIKDIPAIYLNAEESGITLRKDGTATLKLLVNDGIAGLADMLLGDLGTENIDMVIVRNMLYEYMPGLDFSDLNKVKEVFEGGLSIKFLGLDAEDAELQDMFADIHNRGVIVPSKIKIPKGFGIEVNADYYIKDVTSGYTGKTYTGVYMGNAHPDGETFLMMEVQEIIEDNTAKKVLFMNYPLIDIFIYAIED